MWLRYDHKYAAIKAKGFKFGKNIENSYMQDDIANKPIG